MPDWPIRTIEECSAPEPYSTQIGPFGKALTPDAYVSSGVPLLRGVNVNNGRYHDDDYVFISDADADRLSKFESFPGDVLLVHKGSLGQIGLMPERRRFDRYIMGNSMMRVMCDRTKLLPAYLRYWLQSPDGQSYLLGRVSQVGVPQLQRPLTTLREAALPVPPVELQEKVVNVLGSLEDKIEQNRRTSRALEGLARATFKAWFVDFEPVKAKAAGQTSFPGMLTAVFATLPTRFTDSVGRTVPAGWTVQPLETCISHLIDHRGKTPKKLGGDWSQGGIPALSAKNVKAGRIIRAELTNFVDDEMFRRWMPEPLALNDIVMTSEAPLGELVYLARNADYCLSQRVFGIRANRDVVVPSYLYRFLESDDAQTQLAGRASGTTVVGIRQSELRKIAVSVPPIGIQRAAAGLFQGCADLATQLDESTEKLATLRDYLLPLLLSGRVRVREAEQTIGAHPGDSGSEGDG